MYLLPVVEVLIVIGVLLYLVNRFVPMQETVKSILNGVVIIATVLYVLSAFGLFDQLNRVNVGR